jgi:dTDP-4-dehydrorhamnose 3,5-epimerase
MIRIQETALPGVLFVTTPVHADARGFFLELFHAEKFSQLGLPRSFAQSNHSRSSRGTLRGLHYQLHEPQGKLVRPITGRIFDVAVDLRRSSDRFGEWMGAELEAGDGRALYVPPGFAHGFLVLSDVPDVWKLCTTCFDAASDRAVAWNDPTIGITWPLADGAPLLSPKDAHAPPLSQADLFE